ncbi:DUF397 domain-containing protein [Streptomyces sp. NPDC002156]
MAGTELDLSTAVWRKSSYSTGGECVEVSSAPGVVPVLLFRAGTWAAFLTEVKG